MQPTETFDLGATMSVVWQALNAVVCTIGFQAATHGLVLALMMVIYGWFAQQRSRREGKPLIVVARKLCIFCGILAVPGLIALSTSGHLPPVNQLKLSSFGLFGFWSLVIAHLCLEEMNYEWFPDR